MEFAKGLAAGFVAGVAVIGAAVALLYYHDDSAHELEAARIAELEAQVQRLEQALIKSSGQVTAEPAVMAIAEKSSIESH